jgi:Ion channel
MYYSMTTLTSTGYGEITPVHPAARSLAMLQQWVGVMFVGILIARLAGLHQFRRIRQGSPAAPRDLQ